MVGTRLQAMRYRDPLVSTAVQGQGGRVVHAGVAASVTAAVRVPLCFHCCLQAGGVCLGLLQAVRCRWAYYREHGSKCH